MEHDKHEQALVKEVDGQEGSHLLHATSMSVLHGLGAVWIWTTNALEAANNGISQVKGFETSKGVD